MGILDVLFPLDQDGYYIPPTDVGGFLFDELILSWESQVAQYPATGEPGISYFKGVVDDDEWVDCLLFRTHSGQLVGILNYYGFDFPPFERKGNVNIFVRPDARRWGIGRALLIEARTRWTIDPDQQRYTRGGKALADSFKQTARCRWCGDRFEPGVDGLCREAPVSILYHRES